jgi:hypothetical protein
LKPHEPILALFPSRTHNSAVQNWFQNFGLIFWSMKKNKKVNEKSFCELTLMKKLKPNF